MKCETCGETAMRHGTKGRAYCWAHDAEAFKQVKRESTSKSALKDALADEWMRQKWQEREMLG
jgi:hypothetical protein